MPKHEETAAEKERFGDAGRASMRPRAEARGNHPDLPDDRADGDLASMRPRAEARGNGQPARSARTPRRRFNEASCRSTRKRSQAQGVGGEMPCFNEASCRSTRKPRRVHRRSRDLRDASMRPRAEARGNQGLPRPRRRAQPASMRPRAEARGNPVCARSAHFRRRRFNEASCRSTRKHLLVLGIAQEEVELQ